MKTLITIAVFLLSACAAKDPSGNEILMQSKRPNILLIIGDDMGFSDLGVYGGEVATPNIDAIANQGLQFTNFHVAATCSPTRSLLLSGVDNHLNGLGNMHIFITPEQRGKPGYEGYLNKRVVSIASLLKNSGYRTSLAGKWHLGSKRGFRPHDRGFEKTFAFMPGGGDNWSSISGAKGVGDYSIFTQQGEITKRPAGIHSNKLYSDRLIEFIGNENNSDKPFFAYLSYQTAHWPHQAPKKYVEKYRKQYQAGWDAIRKQRIEKLRELNIISQQTPDSPRFPIVSGWQDLDKEQQQTQANRMAAQAGMIEHMDHHIGRVIQHLKDINEYDNTVIIFMSDNGPDRSQPYFNNRSWYDERYPRTSIEEIGLKGSFSSYGPGWAQVAAAHLSGFKAFSTEGGLRVPLLIRFPEKLKRGLTDEFIFVTDLSATILDIAKTSHPGSKYRGRDVLPIKSKSFLPLLQGNKSKHRDKNDWLVYELLGNYAVFQGDYKAVYLATWMKKAIGATRTGDWRLFNLKQDPSELNDLSKTQPQKMANFISQYQIYKTEMGLVEMPADFDPVKEMNKSK